MRIQGGTHLGVVGCFRERNFDTDDIEEVKKTLLEEFDKGELPLGVHPGTESSSDLEWIQTDIHGLLGWSLFKKDDCKNDYGKGRVIFEITEISKDGKYVKKVSELPKEEQEKLVKTRITCV